MKNLLYLLFVLLLSTKLSAQDITPDMFVLTKNTGANMTIVINSPDFDQFAGGLIGAFYDLDYNGSLECVGLILSPISSG